VHDASVEVGDETGTAKLDYRYVLANERTFLAWIRTALALLAAGVAVRQIALPFTVRHGRGLLSDLCLGLAVAVVVLAYQRWRAAHRAMAEGAPLPGAGIVRLLAFGMVSIAVLATMLVALR
jgi:putative membrane protein